MENIFEISIYCGLIGFLMLIVSVLTGMRIIKFKPVYRVHKRIGIIGFTITSLHALVMIYFYYFS